MGGFKNDLFEEIEEKTVKQTLFDLEVEEAYIRSQFNDKELKKMRLLDQEYRLLFDQIPIIRKKINLQNRRIQLACTLKLFAQATITEQDPQDEVIEIGEKCTVILQFLKDHNSFYRSFIVQYIFKLIYNNKNAEDCKKSIFKFLKQIERLNQFDCNYPVEFYRFQSNDLKCFLQSFILRVFILKLRGVAPNLEKVIKIYNDQPEVDVAAIVICKNLLSVKFQKLLIHETYKFLIDDNQNRIVPQILSQYDETINQTIVALFVEVFKCNMIIMNDERAEHPEYFIPQTKKPLYEDIYIYRSHEGIFYSIFEKNYSQQYLEFCVKEGNLYQQDLRELGDRLQIANQKLAEDNDEDGNDRKGGSRKWMERVTNMEQQNKEMKAKQEDYFPVLSCCECERELSDNVPLLKFDVFYFCEACIQDMIAHLNRDEKQFTYIGQTQVKRFQLRDALTELNNERERLKTLKLQEQTKKKNIPNKSGMIGFKESQDLLNQHKNNSTSQKQEKKWENMQKVCIKCNDDQCYEEEIYLFQEVKTFRQVAICMSCLVFLNEQVKYTYRNVVLHKSFEISNDQIKEVYREFARLHLEKTQESCVKCLKVRMYNYEISQKTKSQEHKIICKQCFIEIFQQDEKMGLYKISDRLKESILDQLFREDYKENVCVSCDKKGLKTLTIENVSNSNYINRDEGIKSGKSSKKQSTVDLSKFSRNELKDNESNAGESDNDEDEDTTKRVSRLCVDCAFLNIGKCKNPFMDYLIRYVKLKTNIVYKYNEQVKLLIDNDGRKKMQNLLMTCAMCLRKLKDLYQMNQQDQRICGSCFVQYKQQFQLNNGYFDNYYCDYKCQEQIYRDILAHLVDLTQCIGCKEKIKSFTYEVTKINQSYSNVIICDNCIQEQLLGVNLDLKKPYEIKSAYFNNETIILQNKKEINMKIQQFNAENQKANPILRTINDNNNDQDENQLFNNNNSNNSSSKQRQHLTNKKFSIKCFNKTCKEVELSEKNKTELKFIRMPKCQCIFCIHCFTSFYFKLAEASHKKQQQSKKQNKLDNIYSNTSLDQKKAIPQDEVERFCPSMLCSSKYSEYQIRELANGYSIQIVDEEQKEIEYKQELMIEEENAKKYQNQMIPCTVCNKENKLLVVMNDDFFILQGQEKQKQQQDYQKMNDFYLNQKEDEFLKEIVGNCECGYSCKPCLFQIYYKDRCIRCLRKPSSHIYRVLFNFKKNMICSQCQFNEFTPLEDGLLLTRTHNRYQCNNCKKKYEIE